MAYENIIFETAEGIATITFNRPKALNALNGHLLDELSRQPWIKSRLTRTSVYSILTGAGEKSFVAGADITELATFNTLQGKMFSRKGQLIISRLQELAIPVIAAVNGFRPGRRQ
jgi:enoyl-CoA hydratase